MANKLSFLLLGISLATCGQSLTASAQQTGADRILGSVGAGPTRQVGTDCDTGMPAAASEYTIPVASRATDSVAADALSSYFLNPAGSIFTNDHWGVLAPAKYLAANDYRYLSAKSRYCSRDMEVDTWARNGIVFLRLTSEGTAVYFFHNGEASNGYLDIGVVKGFTEGVGFRYTTNNTGGDYDQLWQTSDLIHLAPGYSRTATGGQVFTFGVSGFDIYAKLNGVEFLRIKDYRNVKSGRAAIQTNEGYGFRDVTVRNFRSAQLFSNLDANLIDLRDFGLNSIATTGSISQNSNRLILPADEGFKVGDNVIVAVGGEAGGGLYGSIGVGGAWPHKSYPSFLAMQADSTQPDGTYASIPSADVYQSWTGTWSIDKRYYFAKISPTALSATVVALSSDGRTLILDKQALAATNNANVYYDNSEIFNRFGEDSDTFTPPSLTLYFPAGDFAISHRLVISRHTGWTVAGAGQELTRVFSPVGAESAHLWVLNAPNTTVRDLHLEGNVGDNGYGLSMSGNPFSTGVEFSQSNNSVAEDLTITNVWWKAVGSTFSDNVWAYRIKDFLTAPIRTYVQWQFQWSDSSNGGCIDCAVTSTYLTGGFNGFRSEHIQWIRPVGINAPMAINVVGDFRIQDAKITIKGMSQFQGSEASFSHRNPVINVNSNIDQKSPLLQIGGTIANATIIEEGYINSNNDVLRGIVVNKYNHNVTIQGGNFQSPGYIPPSEMPGANGIDSAGANTLVDGFRVVGYANPNYYPGFNIALLGAGGTLKNCVADTWRSASGRVTNCMTNAEYNARLLNGAHAVSTASNPSASVTVNITSPNAGSVVMRKTRETIAADAQSAAGIGRVEFLVNSKLACIVRSAPYICPWTPDRSGKHILDARAFDNRGNLADAVISVTAR